MEKKNEHTKDLDILRAVTVELGKQKEILFSLRKHLDKNEFVELMRTTVNLVRLATLLIDLHLDNYSEGSDNIVDIKPKSEE